MDFEENKKHQSDDPFKSQFQNSYSDLFSQTGDPKSYQNKINFDDYSSSQYTDFSQTDHFFKDDQSETKQHQKLQYNYESKFSSNAQYSSNDSDKYSSLQSKNSHNETNQNIYASQQKIENQPNAKPSAQEGYRVILDLEESRQKELKALSEEEFFLSKQYQLFQSGRTYVNWKLSIADYYEKVIPDKEFNKWVTKTRRNSNYREIAFWATIPAACYLYFAAKMNYLPKVFVNNAKLIPLIPLLGLFAVIQSQTVKIDEAREFFKEPQHQRTINMILRRYLCQTSKQERYNVYWAN